MNKKRNHNKRAARILNMIIYMGIPFLLQPEFAAVAYAQKPEVLQEEVSNADDRTDDPIDDEVVAGTQNDLQEALNGETPVIKIKPGNGGKDFILDQALTISGNRKVSLVAESEVKIIGGKEQWQFIISPGADVNIQFQNIVLDGNNAGSGIYNQGMLALENVEIQNCFNYNSGAGIYNIGSLTINNSRLTGNTANKGPAIYVADAANVNMANCTLTNNTGTGAIFVKNSALAVTNSTIGNNNGQGIYGYADGGDTEITIKGNTVVNGNAAKTSYGGGMIGYTWGEGRVTINLRENAVISGNEAINGGGIASYPGSNVIINVSDNVQIVNNTAYESGGGIYGEGIVSIHGGRISSNTAINGGGIYCTPGTAISIRDAIISDNAASMDGGGIWVANLDKFTADNLKFQDNSASAGCFWRAGIPADDKQMADAATHQESIRNTSFTMPYTNAYNNYDINYTTDTILMPYTVTYNGNSNDHGSIPTAEGNPYLAGEEVPVLMPPESLTKAGYRFLGWNTKPDGTGKQYAYDKEHARFMPQIFTMANGNMVLYAQWGKIVTLTKSQPLPLPNKESGAGIGEKEDLLGYPFKHKRMMVSIELLILSGLFLYFSLKKYINSIKR